MVKIVTDRLVLYPLTDIELKELIKETAEYDLKEAYNEMLSLCLKYPDKRIWYTAWFIVLKNTYEIVGDFCFKGLSEDEIVEIGYGLRDGYCGNGYMTEAVNAIIKWALNQRGVKSIEAETEPNNIASQNVLTRCGFVKNGEIGAEGPRFVLKNR